MPRRSCAATRRRSTEVPSREGRRLSSGGLPRGGAQDREGRATLDRGLQRGGSGLRHPQPLPAPGRTAVHRAAVALGGRERSRQGDDGRPAAARGVPVARLGVRPRDGPVVHGARRDAREGLRGLRRARRHARGRPAGGGGRPGAGRRPGRPGPGRPPPPRRGAGPVRCRDLPGVRRRGLRRRRGVGAGVEREGAAMTDVQVREPDAIGSKRAITLVDGDVHSTMMPGSLHARLSSKWQRHLEEFGPRVAGAYAMFPRMRNGGFRVDARPAEGFPGSDLGMVQEQLLDEYDMDYAVLTPMQAQNFGQEAPELAAEMCRALNDWTREEWLDRDARLLGSICPPHEHPDLAVAEIERLAGDDRFVQVLLPGTMEQGLGNRRYWPILRAAAEAGLPVALHTGGNEMHKGAGWPSYYLEMHVWNGNTMAMQMLSMICAGAFEEMPGLQMVAVETGIAWAAALSWSMDDAWRMLEEGDTTRISEPPSHYLRENWWFTTQPIEEPDDPEHLALACDALGMVDRIMFSSDYPHWDFDAPSQSLPRSISKEDKAKIFAGNACRLYGLPRR